MKDKAMPLILGAGLAGLACKHSLEKAGVRPTLLEKKAHPFGHARSYNFQGITFDEGPHISFTKNKEIQELIWNDHDSKIDRPKILNFWRGIWIPQPVITNIYALPVGTRLKIIFSFIFRKRKSNVINYLDWNLTNFGNFFTQNFVKEYTRKYWQSELAVLSVDWAGARIYVPKLREILAGSSRIIKSRKPKNSQHYFSEFHYSETGGFEKLFTVFSENLELHCHFNSKIILVNLERNFVKTENGETFPFTHLFSSIPIPDFLCLLDETLPIDVENARKKLIATSVCLVDLIYSGAPLIDCHWAYVYDPEFLTTRFHFPQSFNKSNKNGDPVGIQIEVYNSDSSNLEDSELIRIVSEEMKKMGIFKESPITGQVQRIKYANVIFDRDRAKSLEIINSYLSKYNVSLMGRYGRWDYSWSDDAILSGFDSASKYLKEVE
jgi:protoporphyrinogen oxidase